MSTQLGVALLVGAAVLAVAGLLALTGALAWFGRLPGDVRIGDDDAVRVFIPITSMLLLSVLLTALLAVLRRIL